MKRYERARERTPEWDIDRGRKKERWTGRRWRDGRKMRAEQLRG